jgi:hypothetical protein
MKRSVLPIVIAAALFVSDSRGDWVQGKGERLISQDISENDACNFAEQIARKDAIQQATGELMASEDLMICREEKNKASCVLNQVTLSTITGVIRGTKKLDRQIAPGVGGHNQCVIVLDVDVGEGIGRYDPSFDMNVELNNRTFRSGELLEITVAPNEAMYISVFQWLPYEKTELPVQKIFPNPLDQKNHFQKTTTIPTEKARSRYKLEIAFPEGIKGEKDRIDEYLMVVGTRTRINWMSGYTLEELNSRMLEIPRRDQRIIRKGYYVVKR